VDISKLRKKIREAQEKSRNRDPLLRSAEAPEERQEVQRTAPEPETRVHAPGPDRPEIGEPAVLSERPGTPIAKAEPETDMSASSESSPSQEAVPIPEEVAESGDEVYIDDYLDRDAVHDRAREGQQVKVLAFRLGDEEYAVSMMDMKEVQIYREVTRVPRTPSYVLGIMSLRGKVIPVLDLRRRLGIRSGIPEAPRILVFSMEGEPVGAQVDSISGVITTWTDEIMPSLNTLSDNELRFISGVIRTENRFVSMLNLEELLNIEMEA